MWLTFCTAVVGYVPDGAFKRWLTQRVSMMCFAVLSSALSSVINYHNPQNKPQNGICVANHTSPIDVLVLMCDNCYSLVCLLSMAAKFIKINFVFQFHYSEYFLYFSFNKLCFFILYKKMLSYNV